jgi:N-acetylmuramoyl-L-alanine amidase
MSGILIVVIILLSFLAPALQTNAMEKVVVIDPGHGEYDPGKIGVHNEIEKDINLEIALKLKTVLEEQGVTVVMTRTADEGLYEEGSTNKKTSDMKARCDIINETSKKYTEAITVSIHQNSYPSNEVSGPQVFYYESSEKGESLALSIQQTMNESLKPKKERTIKANSDYYILLNSDSPAVIVECGFLSNEKEAYDLSQEDYQQQVAESIAAGINDYFETN